MSQNIDLRRIKRRSYIAYFQDGLWDIYWGLAFLIGGLGAATRQVWIICAYGLLVVLLTAAKERITYPRMGYVKFAPPSRKAVMRIAAVLAIPVLAVVAMLVIHLTGSHLFGLGAGLRRWILTSLFLLFALGFGMFAYTFGVTRFYVYAGLMALTSLGDPYTNEPLFAVVYFTMACTMLVTGLVTLVRFLRDYPREGHPQSMERMSHDGR